MTAVLISFVVLGIVGIPLFISFFDEAGKRSRREQQRKTALTAYVARRAHGG